MDTPAEFMNLNFFLMQSSPIVLSEYWIKLRAYLELMRPANIVTAFADILAGYSIAVGVAGAAGVTGAIWKASVAGVVDASGEAGAADISTTPEIQGLLWLLLATFGLYGGGVVCNDFFDAKLDAKERPERPVPSGRTSRMEAGLLGTILLLTGSLAAFQVNTVSGGLAVLIVLFVLMYDVWAKHDVLWGPLFMGLCRGGNLLLGASIVPLVLMDVWFLGIIPILYIAAITLISQGEVHGGSKKAGITSLAMLGMVFIGLIALPLSIPEYHLATAVVYLIFLGILILPAFVRAAFNPVPDRIRFAVKRGVLSLIVLNAVIASGFAGWTMGIVVLLLLPLSLLLGRLFAVT